MLDFDDPLLVHCSSKRQRMSYSWRVHGNYRMVMGDSYINKHAAPAADPDVLSFDI